MLVAKEQPVATGSTQGFAVSKKRPERCDAGSRPYHNHITVISRQPELVVFMNVKFHFTIDREPTEIIGTQTKFALVIYLELVTGNGYMYFALLRFRRR